MKRRHDRSRRGWRIEALEGRRLMTADFLYFGPEQPPAFVHFNQPNMKVGESAGVIPITITRTGDLTAGATTRVRTGTIDALEGYDFAGLDQPVAFAPGQAEATFYLTILDDDVSEPVAKSFTLHLYEAAEHDLLPGTSSMSIALYDDEPGSESSLSFHAFGDDGLWTYNNAEGYRKINDVSPEAIYSAPNRGAYLDFGSAGLWSWDALRGYEKLSDSDAQGLLTSERGESLLIDFGPGGLWNWSRAGGYARVTDVDPEAMAGTIDRTLVDFGPAGLWTFDGAYWLKLDDGSPEAILAHGRQFYVDFGARGLWQTSTVEGIDPGSGQAGYLTTILAQINPADPDTMTKTEVAMVFGFGDLGLWNYNGLWTRLKDVAPAAAIATQGGLYLDYGDAGLWRLANDFSWYKLNDEGPAAIAHAAPATRSFPISPSAPPLPPDVIDLDYGDGGLWRWSAAGWRKLTSARVTAMGVARNDTGVFYGIPG